MLRCQPVHIYWTRKETKSVMRAVGHSICAIAGALQRAKSTVSRELRRNALPSERYSPHHAAGAYQLRRRREAILEKDLTLRTFVRDRLAEGWAPEQIAGWLKAGNERGLRALGFEAIYAFINRVAHKGEDLWRYLRRCHKRRRPRRSRPSRDTIKDRVSIHQRPKNIDARTEVGHREGDLIICKRTRPVLVLHERKHQLSDERNRCLDGVNAELIGRAKSGRPLTHEITTSQNSSSSAARSDPTMNISSFADQRLETLSHISKIDHVQIVGNFDIFFFRHKSAAR